MKDFKRFVESLTPETVAKIFDDAGRNTKSVTVYSDDLEKKLGSLATSQATIDFKICLLYTSGGHHFCLK